MDLERKIIMYEDNSSKAASQDAQVASTGNMPSQLSTASYVPFALRAWWLREFKEYSDLDWCGEAQITGPLWSSYSDPLCDSGSLDFGF